MTLKIENVTAVNFDEWKGLITTTTVTAKRYWVDAAGKALSGSIDKQILKGVYDEYPVYTDGTKLLRDAAQAADDYLWKKRNTRSGWKTRYEIRNV